MISLIVSFNILLFLISIVSHIEDAKDKPRVSAVALVITMIFLVANVYLLTWVNH